MNDVKFKEGSDTEVEYLSLPMEFRVCPEFASGLMTDEERSQTYLMLGFTLAEFAESDDDEPSLCGIIEVRLGRDEDFTGTLRTKFVIESSLHEGNTFTTLLAENGHPFMVF